MSRLLEKYQINIWMYGYSQIQGTLSRWRTMGQICPVLSTWIWTLSPGLENNHTLWSGIFPTILTYMIMLENCQIDISVYGCSPIQGTTFYSCWNLMKPWSQSGTYTEHKIKFQYLPKAMITQFPLPCSIKLGLWSPCQTHHHLKIQNIQGIYWHF